MLNIYIAILTQELTGEVLFINLLIALIGLVITHVYRNYILKYKINLLSTERLIIRLAIVILAMSIVYNVLYYFCLFFFYHNTHFKFQLSSFLGSFVSVYFIFSVWSIIYFAWTYVENNRKQLIDRLKMEAVMKDLEIKTIRSNLQPHFIFNSLNSIRALIDENPELARKAITQISNILRSSITKQDPTDSLENEMKLVEDYLALEKIRFEERLHFKKAIDPSTLAFQIPTMMMQTLVENAIKHGISSLQQGGNIFIKTSLENNEFVLEIINSGQLVTEQTHENSLGFGLNSTQQRLKLIYGDNASFSIFQEDGFVHVLIKIKSI